jgi:hypothetical protein
MKPLDSSALFQIANDLDDYISHAWDAGSDVEMVRCALDKMEERIYGTLIAHANSILEEELTQSIRELKYMQSKSPATPTPGGSKEPF